MRIDLLLKLAFMLAIPVYGLVAWLVTSNPALKQTEFDPILAQILAAVFFLGVVIEPFVSRAVTRRTGGYTRTGMLVKLAFFVTGGIYGLVLTMMSYDMSYVLAFGSIALFLMLLRVPLPKQF